MAPDYEHLTLMQKVEVFEHALETTKGDDPGAPALAQVALLRGLVRSARQLHPLAAVMSMVGYVLGLETGGCRVADYMYVGGSPAWSE